MRDIGLSSISISLLDLNRCLSDDHHCLTDYLSGLETMHLLTQAKNYELRVDMEDFEGQKVFAQYSSFSVGPETDGYRLSLGSFTKGAAGETLFLSLSSLFKKKINVRTGSFSSN